jgi:uncharacterized protein (DUF1330 family)
MKYTNPEASISGTAVLTLTRAVALAQQGADEARAMLDKAIAAVKADQAVALAMFLKGEGGFLNRDLYPFCLADGKTLASPKVVPAGTDVRSLKDAKGNAYGEAIYAAGQKPEGEITEVSGYLFPKPGTTTPTFPKTSFVTKVGELGLRRRILQRLTRRKLAMNTNSKIALAILAGAALGAAATQGLRAQAKPAGYYVAEITVKDQASYMKDFVPPATKSLQDAGGKFVIRGGRTIATQGSPPAPRVVVLQFDSLDKAEAWWNSPAQKAAQAIGDKYATFRAFLVEGVGQ